MIKIRVRSVGHWCPSTDTEQDAHIHAFECVNHLPNILRPARRPENCATFFLNVGNEVGGEFNGFVSVFVREAFIPVRKTEDRSNSVVVEQAEHYGSYHVVESWTQSPAGDDSAFEFRRIEENSLSRARHFESRRLFDQNRGIPEFLQASHDRGPVRHHPRSWRPAWERESCIRPASCISKSEVFNSTMKWIPPLIEETFISF